MIGFKTSRTSPDVSRRFCSRIGSAVHDWVAVLCFVCDEVSPPKRLYEHFKECGEAQHVMGNLE